MDTVKYIIYKLLKFGGSPRKDFLSYHYQRHNSRRLEHLASLGLKINGSSVLEVGAGIGDHTHFFLDRGCHVVTSDARQNNLQILRSRYPNIRVRHIDLEHPDSTFNESFDIVYCYGVLYHLKDPTQAIEFMSRICRNMLLLETCVSFGDEDLLNPCPEEFAQPTQSVSGKGCRPTRSYVYYQLKRHFEFVYLPITQPNYEEFPIDWTSPPSKETINRAVFVASRDRLNNELLTEKIPMQQRRH